MSKIHTNDLADLNRSPIGADDMTRPTIEIPALPSLPFEMSADDRPSFDDWLARVDALLVSFLGLASADLPDCLYRDWYDDRTRPIHAANMALDNAIN